MFSCKTTKAIFEKVFLILMLVLGFIFFTITFFYVGEQHFVLLAKSFIEGKLYFTEIPAAAGWADTSLFNGHHYWPLGMFSALLLTPFVFLFGTAFRQGYVSYALTVLNFFLLYKISNKISAKKIPSMLISSAYIFCSAYIMVGLNSVSWYFAHVVASSCLLLAIYFTLVKPRPVLAGLFFSFGFLTRISLIFGIVFFFPYYFFLEHKLFISRVLKFLIPVSICVLLFFFYNYSRFGNILETGYRYQSLDPAGLAGNREVGMWSFKHYPANLYLFLLKGPDVITMKGTTVIQKIVPSGFGMSFILTSPVFLLIFLADKKRKLNMISGVAALCTAAFLFGSFGLGAYQYGYRFALDFQPFLFLILADVFREKELGIFTTLFIFSSFLFNLFMLITLLSFKL